MTENSPLGRLLADALQGSTPYGAGLLARPIASQGLAGLLGMQSFAQRMAAMPQPAPADTARGMLSADFGQGITADDPRVDLAMALSTATPRAGIRAYHGSPHDFDRFDMSRIGTGEGAQAYGHGLYFAGNERVAQNYRNNLSSNRINIGDRTFAPAEFSEMVWRQSAQNIPGHVRATDSFLRGIMDATHEFAMTGRIGAVPDDLTSWMGYGSLAQRQGYAEAARALREAHPATGRMYEVNLRTDPSRLLDWDAPLRNQPEPVREMLRSSWLAHPDAHANQTGEQIYRITARDRAGNFQPLLPYEDSAAAATALREAGIPGIQYLDQGSRAAGQGTRNYVMFDDNLIEIIRKYGIAGLLGSGAGYGMLSPTQAPQNP